MTYGAIFKITSQDVQRCRELTPRLLVPQCESMVSVFCSTWVCSQEPSEAKYYFPDPKIKGHLCFTQDHRVRGRVRTSLQVLDSMSTDLSMRTFPLKWQVCVRAMRGSPGPGLKAEEASSPTPRPAHLQEEKNSLHLSFSQGGYALESLALN